MTRRPVSRSEVHLGTIVTISVVSDSDTPQVSPLVDRAFEWFRDIEIRCSRFDPGSELMQVSRAPGEAVTVSAALFEAVRFAVHLAKETEGAFDPTIGHTMEARGFNREHRSGMPISSGLDREQGVSFRDVECDALRKTICLRRPLILDLGAVAKGLAIDLAARELLSLENFAIDAGGDLFLGGVNEHGEPWAVGIRHPRIERELIDVLLASNQAVCTSGDYERRTDMGHHILDPRTNQPASAVASATVIAPTAMLADAVATAAFVLGPEGGLSLCERLGLEALIITPDLRRHETPGLRDQ